MHTCRIAILVLAAVGFAATPPKAQPDFVRKLDAELAAIVAEPGHELASLSVLAMRNGKVVYQGQFGHRWIDPVDSARSKPAGPGTLYRIASISKLVTTLGVMKLREEGRLDLDRDVGDYLGFRFRNPHFPEVPVTLRMLLSHTSSLQDDDGYYWDAKSRTHLREVFTPGGKRFGEGRMWARNAPPGAYFQYANLPWGVVGTVMERVTGERFDRLMRRLILDPMRLPGGFHPADLPPADLDHVATLYRKRKDVDGREVWDPKGPWIPQADDYATRPPAPRALPDYVPGTNGTLFGPQGNCRLSAEGLGRIMLMLMDGGTSGGRRILRRSSVELMLKEQWRADRAAGNHDGENNFGRLKQFMNAWGLGVQHFLDLSGPGAGDRLVEPGGFRAMGHIGDAWGLTSLMAFNRTSRNGLVFLIGGSAFDPEAYLGTYSGLSRHEERILTALHRRAILRRTD